MEKQQVIVALGALAHPLRLDVFRALVVAGAAGVTPGRLVIDLAVPAATLSFHLKELVAAGLVRAERMSRNIVYRADYAQMDGVLRYLTQNCCQGQSCVTAPVACCHESDATVP